MPNIPKHAGAASSDSDLIARIRTGDEAALATLYDRYSRLVYSVASRVLREGSAAEEILQDIFYQLWRNPWQYDVSRGGLGAWLLVSARNRAIDRLRRNKPGDCARAEQMVSSGLNLESHAAQAELMSKVQAALSSLSSPQRETLELAYFEGMTHSEIAERTGEPLGTVKTRLRSAIQALRQVLNP
ncbi:MAG TPA: sigma-70 family RNA polymerase sigma factor [Terriglobia bacterium]|nr:sigma-70 family RNA polymerase sigma factor [Terriglobia bacterium]